MTRTPLEKKLEGRVLRGTAPAKLNLRLKVVGRRADGYHLLSMVNVLTTLSDSLSLSVHAEPEISLTVSGTFPPALTDDLNDPMKNLAARAARDFFSAFDLSLGAAITLDKHIPVHGGLGGGSSDAAAVLRMLGAALAQAAPDLASAIPERLQEIALTLGADVPYPIEGGLCAVGGVGEALRPLPLHSLDGIECILACPAVGTSTPQIFSRYRTRFPEIRQTEDRPVVEFAAACQSMTPAAQWRSLLALIENDLEPDAIAAEPVIGQALEVLRAIPGILAGLTGSGSTMFAVPEEGSAIPDRSFAELAAALKPLDVTVYKRALQLRPDPVDI